MKSSVLEYCASVVVICALTQVPVARAIDFDTGESGVKLRWDNTVKYTLGFRVKNPDQTVAASAANPNVDAGDLNFNRGLINNRLDLLSEIDVTYKDVGLRVSGAAWYDSVYNKGHNDYPSGMPPNTQAALLGGANNRFTSGTRDLMGRRSELSDAFVFGRINLGDERSLTVRAGRHTLLYGETLFLGANGIAAAQGPVDLIKAFSLPNAQFKEIALPVGQISADLQVTSSLSIGLYDQLEWRATRLPATGSYFSVADFVGEGADLLLSPLGAENREPDQKGKNGGQYGVRIRLNTASVDYGLYAAKYDDKTPIPVLDATVPGRFGGGVFRQVYAKNISVFGASFSTVVADANVAGEISTRRNTPLAPLGDLIISTIPGADNDRNTPYARGNTLHANFSAISLFAGNRLWDGASIVGEYAYNRLLSVVHDPVNALGIEALNSTHTRNSSIVRFVFQPEYFQVFQGIDLRVPLGVGYGISGRSAVLQLIPEHGGDLTIAVNMDVRKIWSAGIAYTHYYGARGPAPSLPALGPTGTYASYKQFNGDRDFVTLTAQRTF